jgi:lysophospholipase L1-like esterase
VNRYGYLYPELRAQRRTANELRVAAIGGSTVESSALRAERRWPARLEEKLTRAFPQRSVTVLNLGITAQGTQTHLATMTQHVVHIGVDVVVFQLGANEVYRASPGYQRLLDSNSFRPTCQPESARHWVTRLQLGRRVHLGYRSMLKAMGYEGGWGLAEAVPYFEETRNANSRLPPLPGEIEVAPAALDEYERDVTSLASVARAHGIAVLFVSQPMLWHPGMSPQERAVCWLLRTERNGRVYQVSPETAAATMSLFNRRLREVCIRQSLPFLDLADRLPTSLEFFYDDVHFNEKGADRVADELTRALEPILTPVGRTAAEKTSAP